MDDPSYETELRVRFRDLDALGHVNNAVYGAYFEIIRGEYYHAVIGDAFEDVDAVMVHLEIDYFATLSRFDSVTVMTRLGALAESSIQFAYELVTDDEPVATGETVQVVADPETGQSVAIPNEWRESMTVAEPDDPE